MKQQDEDRWLKAAISALPQVQVPGDLKRRIAEIPIVHPQIARPPWFSPLSASLWWSLCGALGILCGVYLDVTRQAESSFAASPDQQGVGWSDELQIESEQDVLSPDAPDQEELLTAAFASQLSAAWDDTWGDPALTDEEETP